MISWDLAVFRWINGWPHGPWLDGPAQVISGLGDQWLALALGAVAAMVGRGRVRRLAGLTLVALLITLAVVGCLKGAINRPRPVELVNSVMVVGPASESPSFPSGHAAISGTVAGMLSAKFQAWRWLWWALAGLVALSRVYLGLHFPADVLAGMAIGACSAWLMVRLSRRWLS